MVLAALVEAQVVAVVHMDKMLKVYQVVLLVAVVVDVYCRVLAVAQMGALLMLLVGQQVQHLMLLVAGGGALLGGIQLVLNLFQAALADEQFSLTGIQWLG
jgi:hypothetical protein